MVWWCGLSLFTADNETLMSHPQILDSDQIFERFDNLRSKFPPCVHKYYIEFDNLIWIRNFVGRTKYCFGGGEIKKFLAALYFF